MMSAFHSEISKMLAALAYYKAIANPQKNVNYNYIDKVANASTKDMALYHIREAFRDFDTLKNNDDDMKKALSVLEGKAEKINYAELEKEIDYIERLSTLSELRQKLSRIAVDAINLGNIMMSGES